MSAEAEDRSLVSWAWHWLQELLPGLIVAALVFDLLPTLDLQLSGLFYWPGAGFFLERAWPVRVLYYGTPWLVGAIGLGLIGALVWANLSRHPQARRVNGVATFALVALALGPGLIANALFKDHWGRPRPEQIVEFGGNSHYVPPLLPSSQCRHNCSFVSGHAAVGFFLITGAWVWPHRRRTWYAVGIVAGSLIGLARIAQGGHFLSDVVGAFAVVWLTDELLYRFMLSRGWLEPPPAKKPK